MTIAELKKRVLKYAPEADLQLLERAYQFGRRAHAGQHRLSGDDFIEHPLAVAGLLTELRMDVPTLAAALLHDVVEDTAVDEDELENNFGREIAQLVDGVTKLGQLEFRSQEEEQVENLRKMFLAMARDIRVILIKLCDRLHNMRTLGALPYGRRQEVARETLEIFAPLAHRLGIFRIKWELEDLSLRYLEPEKYQLLTELVAKRRQEREDDINRVIAVLRERLAEVGMQADIQGRAKNFYSIFKKMYDQGREFEEIYDLIAMRVLVDTVRDCYGVLGIVHTLWKPIPGRFKDYIAMPKSNMYQSLHTTVIGPDGEPFEVQIRTWEMHRTAEWGIAAHWRYKEGGREETDFDQKLSWLRQILDWQQDLRDAREFMESLKIDLFADEVFVFTPKGDVIDLPAGSTPIDFAYQIHTAVGHRCIGAKVNNKIVPLDYQLKNGNIVEILTSKQATGPGQDWLKIAKTSGAKSKIRSWFKKEKRAENLEKGRAMLEREITRLGFAVMDLWQEEWLEKIAQRASFLSTEDLLVSIGFGGITASYVAGRLRDEWKKLNQPVEQIQLEDLITGQAEPKPISGVRVKGVENVLVRFARCCNPVPGDPIIGYITKGHGVSIHRTDCPNMIQYLQNGERVIEVDWDNMTTGTYPVDIEVIGVDRPGLLSDVAKVVAETKVNIVSAKANANRNRSAVINIIVEIRNLEQLDYIMRRVSSVRDVLKVGRRGDRVQDLPRGG
ncbi:MAG TPA: bifunctional (p)ppGpp synthetase/guanosine-3',5'-bis(diphosphate) 3'-pyrophosphohydrolase [Firmicutes bacterium]|nr:bifunctional (p)ppGpp synthetase/guanosine-3',5'-bis(diphosphate) 3'-pyrophosphohydrolase [Bacillota bacterium]